MSARVTVAVPIYNGAQFLRETLRSLLDQTLEGVKIICVDDHSADESATIAREAGVTVVSNERRLGMAANWNRALALVDSPYFVIAHQDDIYEREFLEQLLLLIEEHPKAFIAHARGRYVDEQGLAIDTPASRYKETLWPRGATYERGGPEELHALIRGNYIICPAVMFRSEAVRLIGPFSSRYDFVTDWDYWIRGVAAGYTVTGTARRLMRWRRHRATSTATHTVSFRRFEEERMLLEEVGPIAEALGAPVRPAAQFAAVRHTLIDEFLTRLESGDKAMALAIAEFMDSKVPNAHRTARFMRIALRGGTTAGRTARALGRTWFALTSRLRR